MEDTLALVQTAYGRVPYNSVALVNVLELIAKHPRLTPVEYAKKINIGISSFYRITRELRDKKLLPEDEYYFSIPEKKSEGFRYIMPNYFWDTTHKGGRWTEIARQLATNELPVGVAETIKKYMTDSNHRELYSKIVNQGADFLALMAILSGHYDPYVNMDKPEGSIDTKHLVEQIEGGFTVLTY